ncbi:MAG: 3-aminobutyryl-CoA ammonia lyase [Cyanobacteria bacterium NC_groundwater_1444_Ag_S-0.65um_54_12]|nr:3-aminobutyryl-CoA ammonia lyase [Cyanobacteria bacterium NC_groundwater_1444_Ag_S-0.65um_54_12]
MKEITAQIRVRMGEPAAHYAGGLVAGAKLLELFGDVATELLIRRDGDEGLFAGYSEVKFLAPVHAGDYIEATGRIVKEGNTSRTMEFVAYKVISLKHDPQLADSAAEVLPEPLPVCRALGTCVTLKERQRYG